MESINHLKRRADEIGRRSKALFAFAIMTASASFFAGQCRAQTFAEWFAQKKTQKKYLLQQIAALQMYSGYLKQGYKIAKGGLGYISGSLKDEFTLHNTYYDKLKAASSVVKNNPQVDDILIWQRDILTSANELEQVRFLTASERQYIGKVKQAVLADCDEQITSLQVLLTNGKLKLTDGERVSRLNDIHLSMQSNHRFMADFTGRVKLFSVQKQGEDMSLTSSKNLFGIR